MADHMRQQIRDAIKAAVLGTTTFDSRVYIGQVRPLAKDKDPSLLIYTRSETSKRDANGRPPIQARRCQLFLELRMATADAPDDALATGQAEVEGKIGDVFSWEPPVTILGGLLLDLEYVGCEEVVEASGEKNIGGLRLEYAATYRVAEGSPTAAV